MNQNNILRKIKYLRYPIFDNNKNSFLDFLYSKISVSYAFSFIKNNGGIVPHVDAQRKYISLMLYFPNDNEKEIDAAIEKWTKDHTSDEVLSIMDEVSVPAGPILSVEDMMNDEHYIARGMFQEVEANGRTLHIPAMLPILTETPGTTEWPGPALSEHTDEVLSGLLGKDEKEITQLREKGVL